MKVVIRGKLIALSTSIKKLESSHIINLKAHLKALERKNKASTPKRRMKEIIHIMAEINQLVTKTAIQRIKETKGMFFEKIIKIDKPLDKLTKRQMDSTPINKIRNKMRVITNDSEKVQRIIRSS